MVGRPQVELLADELRSMSVSQCPVHLNSLAGKLGVSEIAYVDIPEEGRLLRSVGGMVRIEIRSDRSVSRKRFTLAHELVHLALDTGERRASLLGETPHAERHSAEERLCDTTAAAILLPSRTIERATDDGLCGSLDGLSELADRHRCSLAATAGRVAEVNNCEVIVAYVQRRREAITIKSTSRRSPALEGRPQLIGVTGTWPTGQWRRVVVAFGAVRYEANAQTKLQGDSGMMLLQDLRAL